MFGKRYEVNLKESFFYQWPKLGLELDVETEIKILKVNNSIDFFFILVTYKITVL